MKFLISGYTGLGNFILKTPMIARIKELYPEAIVDVIAGNSYGTQYILKENDLIDRIHLLSPDASVKEKISFFRKMKALGYSALFLPFDADPDFLFYGSYLAGIELRVRHIYDANPRKTLRLKPFSQHLWAPKTLNVPFLPGRHEIDLNFDLLEAFHNQPIVRNYNTIVQFDRDPSVLEKFNLKQNQYILIQPGAANGEVDIKSWKPENFIQLINKLTSEYGETIVLAGDTGDNERFVKPILSNLSNTEKVINTAGQTNIPNLCNLIENAAVVICHDSGIMHIADALYRPLIALYGPTDYTRTRPLKADSHILFAKNDYFAAMYNFRYSVAELSRISKNQNLLEGISVEDVLAEYHILRPTPKIASR